MKRGLILIALIATFATSQIITIIDNGVKRKISIPDSTNSFNARVVDGSYSSRTKELIIAFKNSNIDINSFAKKYNLELKKRLIKNYYIFINNSNLSNSSLILKIYNEQKEAIKTIRPNYGFGNMPN